MKLSNLIKRKLNSSTYNYVINHFFEEVADDIKILEGKIYYNNPNTFVNYLNEDYELDLTSKDTIKRKYEEIYCPSSLFVYFNKSEKVNYLIMRNKIDKLLNIKGIAYEI
jgi:hypothetical protein